MILNDDKLYGTEFFLRTNHSLSYSRNSLPFMEPEGLLLCSQEPAIGSKHYLNSISSLEY